MTTITRRSFLMVPVAVAVPAKAQVLAALGDVIVELFENIVKVGISMLLESAARYIWANYLNSPTGQLRYIQTAQPYVEGGRCADNFCPYCTVAFAQKGERFWNGELFAPNDDNRYYRNFNRPTDQVLIDMLGNPASLWYLDKSRNSAAHIDAKVLDEIRGCVNRLETDKPRLYYEIERKTLGTTALDQYLIPRPILKELDRQYKHVTSEFHLNRKHVDAVMQLQQFVTWFNTKLVAIENAGAKGELIAKKERQVNPRLSPEEA